MFALEVVSEADNASEKLVYLSGSIITEKDDSRYTLEIKMPDLIDISGLMVRKDKAVPLIYFGSFIFMIGVAMGFFWQHRRIWLQFHGTRVMLAGHTNKNWYGLKQEAGAMIEQAKLPIAIEDKSKA